MLVSFSAKNFYSIKGTVTVSFGSDDKSDKLSPVLAIVGETGAGKTNVLKALKFTLWFMLRSTEQTNREGGLVFEPHFSVGLDELTELSVKFFVDHKLYHYELHTNRRRVMYEALTSENMFYKRTADKVNKRYIYTSKGFDFTDADAEQVPGNVSILSAAVQKGEAFALALRTHIEVTGNIGPFGRTPVNKMPLIRATAAMLYEEKRMLTIANDVFKEVVPNLKRLEIQKMDYTLPTAGEDNETRARYIPVMHYTVKGDDIMLGMLAESDTTQALFCLLGQALSMFEAKHDCPQLLIADDLDADLSATTIKEFVRLFSTNSINTSRAQLIFSRHCPTLKLPVSKNQMVTISKDKSMATVVKN